MTSSKDTVCKHPPILHSTPPPHPPIVTNNKIIPPSLINQISFQMTKHYFLQYLLRNFRLFSLLTSIISY